MACVRDADCSAWRWLIPAVLLIGLCYILLIVWLPINHHPLWKSVTYFMQTVPLIASLDNAMLRTTTAVFTLDPSVLGIHVTACPWSGFTATEKMAADYVLPAVLVVELGLVLALHRLIRWPVAWVGRLRASDLTIPVPRHSENECDLRKRMSLSCHPPSSALFTLYFGRHR
jgi:hypothetical protein